jgi:glycosyltransferase involved in cell wall biosynthesis
VRRAKGDWTAFVDDDVMVTGNWYSALCEEIASVPDTVVGIEGAVDPGGNGLWDHEVRNTHGGRYLTCNIAYRRNVLLRIGGFDEQMNRPFHEDHELAVRMLKQGEIRFLPDMRAIHSPREIRSGRLLRAAPLRMFHLLQADRYFRRKHPAEYPRFRYHKTFYRTYRGILLHHTCTVVKRRGPALLLRNLGSVPLLVLTGVIEQITAALLLPYFLYLRFQDAPAEHAVWFAAAIRPDSNGGVARNMRSLAAGLRKIGRRVELITAPARCDGPVSFSFFLAGRLLRSAWSHPPAWIIARSTDGWLCGIMIRVLRIPTQLVLHNHGWEEWTAEMARRTATRTGPRPLTTWRSPLVRFPLLRLTAKYSAGIICGTLDEMRRMSRKYPRIKPKLLYVPNGVTAQDLRHRRFDPPPSPQFLCIGAWGWRKNLSLSLALFEKIHQQMPAARLNLVGSGDLDEIYRAVENLFCREAVSVYPSIPMEEMDTVYRNAPYLLSTSRYEGGHALAVLEAMARGCIVFVSPIESHLEFVHDGRNGFVLSLRISDDAHRIITILKNDRLQQDVSDAAVKTAERNTWRRQALRLERYLCRATKRA